MASDRGAFRGSTGRVIRQFSPRILAADFPDCPIAASIKFGGVAGVGPSERSTLRQSERGRSQRSRRPRGMPGGGDRGNVPSRRPSGRPPRCGLRQRRARRQAARAAAPSYSRFVSLNHLLCYAPPRSRSAAALAAAGPDPSPAVTGDHRHRSPDYASAEAAAHDEYRRHASAGSTATLCPKPPRPAAADVTHSLQRRMEKKRLA
jgi:hypothetical protein